MTGYELATVNLPLDDFKKLVNSDNELDRECAALNPYLPQELKEQLAADAVTRVRMYIAENQSTGEAITVFLANDEDVNVRIAVAKNVNASETALRMLSTDKSDLVRKSVACNVRTPFDALEVMEKDLVYSIAEAATETITTKRKYRGELI